MTEKQVEQREEAYSLSGGMCSVCGKPLLQGQPQYAHRIGNTEVNRKKYGSFFIDSAENGRYVCSLDCNAKVDVGKSLGRQLQVLIDIILYESRKFNGE